MGARGADGAGFQSAAGPASGGKTSFHALRHHLGVARRFNPPPDPRPAETSRWSMEIAPSASSQCFNPPPDPRPAETQLCEGSTEFSDSEMNLFQSAAGPASGGKRRQTASPASCRRVRFQSAAGPASGGNLAERPTRSPCHRNCFNPPPDPRPAETSRATKSARPEARSFNPAAGPASGGNKVDPYWLTTLTSRRPSSRCFNPPPDPRPAETAVQA